MSQKNSYNINRSTNGFPENMEMDHRYKLGQKLYLEYPGKEEITEFEVAEIKLYLKNGSPQKLYGLAVKKFHDVFRGNKY